MTQHGRHAENKHGINTCALVLRDDPEMQINFVPLLPVVRRRQHSSDLVWRTIN